MIKRIFLDVGHGEGNGRDGGFDPGAVYVDEERTYTEHGMITEQVKRLFLEIKGVGAELVLVPELSREDVVSYCNRQYEDGDFFISLHMNSSVLPHPSGVEIIIAATANNEKRRMQAHRFGRGLTKVLGCRFRRVFTDIESPRGYLTVLRKTKAPAILAEVGFLSNGGDRAAFGLCGAEAIAEGIRLLLEGENDSD